MIHKRVAGVCSLLFLASLLGSPPADAAVLTIDAATQGAKGDGVTLNTTALQKAIDACSAQGGGIVTLPPGRYLTGTLQLKDNVTLNLDEKATLLGSTDAKNYRNLDPFIDGVNQPRGEALVVAVDARHVGISGKGTIDGQGKALAAAQKPYTIRPFLVRWVRCGDVTVKDVTLTGSGAWCMHLSQCQNTLVTGVAIRNRGLANNDGIDIDSCNGVHIEGCDIDTGDDAICLKTTSLTPCQDITATANKLKTSCNAIKLGTESIGDYFNITIDHCAIRDTGMAGIALYSVDGANLHDVTISDITMDNISVPIAIRLGARLKTFRSGDKPRPVGALHDVTIRNVKATGVKQIGFLLNGIPGHAIRNVTLENIDIQVPGGGTLADAAVQLAENEAKYPEFSMFGKVMPAYGLYLRHIDGLTFKDVHTSPLKADARPAMVEVDVTGIKPPDFAPATGPATAPAK